MAALTSLILPPVIAQFDHLWVLLLKRSRIIVVRLGCLEMITVRSLVSLSFLLWWRRCWRAVSWNSVSGRVKRVSVVFADDEEDSDGSFVE